MNAQTCLQLRTLSLLLCAALTACGGASTPTSDGGASAAPKALATIDRVDEAAEATPLPTTAPTSRFRINKPFTLAERQIELPGVPLYPGSQTLALPGIGATMERKTPEIESTSVQYVLEDGVRFPQVAAFFKTALETDGWKGQAGVLTDSSDQDLPIGMLVYQKDKTTLAIRYADGSQENTSPMLSLVYSVTK
jgi:hypothetical protein